MKLYHGTTSDNADAIENEGFYGSELSEMTDGFTTLTTGGVVFLTDDIEQARGYGDVVFEIENVDAVFFQEAPMGPGNEYYVTVDELRNNGSWKRL